VGETLSFVVVGAVVDAPVSCLAGFRARLRGCEVARPSSLAYSR